VSSVLYGLGRAAFRRRWLTLGAWLLVLVVVGGSAAAFSKPFDNQFTLPGTESQQGLDMLSHNFPQVSGASAQMIVVAPAGSTVESSAVRTAVESAVDDLSDLEQVDTVVSPYDKNISGAVSEDERAALVSIQLNVAMADVKPETLDEIVAIAAHLQEQLPGSQASAGGSAFQETNVAISWVDAIGVVVALIVLWVTLGSLRAAGLPLITALVGVAVSTLAVVVGTAFMVINSTTIMLGVMLGLAVGIDYALFILSRHRDQLGHGLDPEESAARSVATSGSAVVFAGLTVMIALAGLAVAGIPFLATMGFAAAGAVAVAVLIAVTALPALMGVMGERLRPKSKKTRPSSEVEGSSSEVERPKKTWADRWVAMATKVPALTVAVIVLGLGSLAIPAASLRLALPDAGGNPIGNTARTTYDLISEHFGPGHNGPLIITADIVASDDPLGVMDGIKERVEQLPGVAAVPLATPNESIDTGIVQVVPTTGPDDAATADLVHRLRELAPEFQEEYGVTTMVTGVTAVQIDVSEQLGNALVPFAILVVGLSLVLLMIVFRSLWVPIKAAVGYLFSVIAAFGVVSLVFEHGVGASLLGLDKTGPVISFLPIILMGILFGLAMDYEVFLVSRIREDHVHGKPAREAIRSGFTASARVVLAAGLIMFAVFAAFVPEGDAILKSIALGLAVGIFVDAFIIRMTLVPAVLQLLGEKAWYLPKWLDRILPSFDVEGEGLQRRLALADWPAPNSGLAVAAAGVRVQDVEIIGEQGIFVQPGTTLTLHEAHADRRTAILLALTGRTPITAGRIKIGELVLPEEAPRARRRTAYIDAASPTVLRDLQRAVRSTPTLVALDHADRIPPDAAGRVQVLLDALTTAGSAVVTSSSSPGSLPPAAPPVSRSVVPPLATPAAAPFELSQP